MIKKNYVILCLLITSLSLFGATAEELPTPPASPEPALEDQDQTKTFDQAHLADVTVPGATTGNGFNSFVVSDPEDQEVASITEQASGASAEASKAPTPPLATQRTSTTPTTNPLSVSVSASSEDTVQPTEPAEATEVASRRSPSPVASDDSFVSANGQARPDDESVKAFFRKQEKSTPAHKATGPKLDANGAGAADPESEWNLDDFPKMSAQNYRDELKHWIDEIELKIVRNEITESQLLCLDKLFLKFLDSQNVNTVLTKNVKTTLMNFQENYPEEYEAYVNALDAKYRNIYFRLNSIIKTLHKSTIEFIDKADIALFKKNIIRNITRLDNQEAQITLETALNTATERFAITDIELDIYQNELIDYANKGPAIIDRPLHCLQIYSRTTREIKKLNIGYGLTTAAACALPWLPRIPMARTMASSAFGFLQNTFGRATLPVIAGVGLVAGYAAAPSFFRMLNGGERPIGKKKLISRASILGFSSGISFAITQGFSGLGSLGLGVAGMIGVTALAVLTEHQNKIRNSGYAFKEITCNNLEQNVPGITRELTALQEASKTRFLITEPVD